MQKKLLIVEDNSRVLEILAFAVGREGYPIIRASDGKTGLRLAQEQAPDLIVLDLTQTEPNSVDICRSLHEAKIESPILLLIASEHQEEELSDIGLRIDSIQKPFSMKELLMRIKVGLWDTDISRGAGEEECLTFGRIAIYPGQALVTKDASPLDLTQREYELLLFFAKEPGKVFSREELLTGVWDYSYLGDTRNVDVTIRRLREKIEDIPSSPSIIATRRGHGYIFTG